MRLVVVLLTMATAVGHACAEPEPSDRVGNAAAAPTTTSPGLSSAADHHAACETPPGASGAALPVLLGRAPGPWVAIAPAPADHLPCVPVPVLRPPRFLLHAALLT
jgi:hypothetical protein